MVGGDDRGRAESRRRRTPGSSSFPMRRKSGRSGGRVAPRVGCRPRPGTTVRRSRHGWPYRRARPAIPASLPRSRSARPSSVNTAGLWPSLAHPPFPAISATTEEVLRTPVLVRDSGDRARCSLRRVDGAWRRPWMPQQHCSARSHPRQRVHDRPPPFRSLRRRGGAACLARFPSRGAGTDVVGKGNTVSTRCDEGSEHAVRPFRRSALARGGLDLQGWGRTGHRASGRPHPERAPQRKFDQHDE